MCLARMVSIAVHSSVDMNFALDGAAATRIRSNWWSRTERGSGL